MDNTRRRRRLAPLLVAAAVTGAAAQVQFRTETTIVQVDVVVRDETGRPVEDLDERAFEVLENGVPQPLVWFERSVGAATPANGPAGQDAGPAGWDQNRSVGTPQSLVAIVFHQLGQQFRTDACRAATAMVDRLPPGDFAAVYLIDQAMTPLTGFTRDRETLRAAIQTVVKTPPAIRPGAPGSSGVAETGGSLPGSGPDQQQAAMRGRMEAGLNNLDAEYDAGMQGAAFSQLVADLDRFPGRRAVFLFSGGLAMPMAAPRIETVADRAAPRHVSFYAIAPGVGMQPYRKGSVTRIERGELTSVSTEKGRRPAKVSERDPSLGLRQLAELTGGLFLTGSSDVDALLARANADRRSFYVLGYRTSAPAAEAGTRPIEVRVTRPGLSVRARTRIGQTAPPPSQPPADDKR
jgi:VWFA-related protein